MPANRKARKTDPRRSTKYKRWAKRVKKERGFLCERCIKKKLVTEGTQLHHKIPLSQGGALMRRSNVELLCKDCHDIHHYGKPQQKKFGMLEIAMGLHEA